MTRPLLFLAFAACATESAPDIEYTGEARRFVVDSIAVPLNNSEARQFGLDLNGDRTVDNQLGMVIATLTNFDDVTEHGADMVASGVIASSVEIVADDFANDDTVAVRYFGADGEHAELIGGALAEGRFTTETKGGIAIAKLPEFVDADPIVVRMTHMKVTLTADGRGGFDAIIAGAIEEDEAKGAAFTGAKQMIDARPADHLTFFRMLDVLPNDFNLTQSEFVNNSIIASLLSPDVTFDRKEMLSIGFRVHLSPCAAGNCVTAPPAAPCFDRVRDADETDIDCGGACGACATGATCATADDCQSLQCNGTCGQPSCGNGVLDGFETDVDCGGQCGGCATGEWCWSNHDCANNRCREPCSGTLCGPYSLDRCD
jgi:hypothetical protein